MAYNISITNGEGAENILNGDYTVTASSNGYDGSTIDPASITVVEGTNEYSFTIGATGTLTLHVTEDGTSTGTAVVGATFIRCDSEGNTYGTEITTDSTGNAVFNNVPYASTDAPIIYYKQTKSDGAHAFDDMLKNTTLTTSTSTIEIENNIPALRTIKLTDENYDGLDIASATISLN